MGWFLSLSVGLQKYIIVGLLVALGLSVAGGTALYKITDGKLSDEREAHQTTRDRLTVCKAAEKMLQGSVDRQNAAVSALVAEQAARDKAAAAALEAAKKGKAKAEREIDEIRNRKPADPTKPCESAMLELRKEIPK